MESTLREKKTQRLQALFTEMRNSGILATPSHLLETFITVQDPEYKDRLIKISMDTLELVKVTVVYHEYKYDNTTEDRRNAIKTAKDIFDFYYDLQMGFYSKCDPALKNEKVPTVSLYYRNSASTNSVVVTSTNRYSYTDFIFNHAELLGSLTQRLDKFTQLIAMDIEGAGNELRWQKEVQIDKQWWKH